MSGERPAGADVNTLRKAGKQLAKASSAKSCIAIHRAKRDFARTHEPAGKKAVPSSSRLRFVIQRHDARRMLYDLRLELDGVFKSWAVTRGPSLDPHDKRLAVEVEDHPLDYTIAISKALFPRTNMAAGQCSCGTAATGFPKAIRMRS